MAVLRINRAKKLIASGLNDKLLYMALYQIGYNVKTGQVLNLRNTLGKSDDSPYYVELNWQSNLDKYKAINDFSGIEWDGDIGMVTGIKSIMNFFIHHNSQVNKLVITDSVGSNGNVVAQVRFPTITPTNGEDEGFFINTFEILID